MMARAPRSWRGLGIRGHLTAALATMTLLTAAALMVVGHRWIMRTMQVEAVAVVGSLAEERRDAVERMVERRRDRARTFLATTARACLAGEEAVTCLRRALRGFTRQEGATGAVVFAGGVLVSEGEMPSIRPAAPLTFVAAPGQGGVNPDVTIAAGDGDAALWASYDGELFDDLFAGGGERPAAAASFMTDARGRVVSASDELESVLGTRKPVASSTLQRCLAGQDGEFLGPNFRGAPVVHGFRSLASIGGGCVLVQVDQDIAFAPAARMRAAMLPVVPVLVIVAILVSFVVARSLTRPLARLAECAREVRAGRFDVQVGRAGGAAEFRDLCATFDDMTAGLRDWVLLKERFLGILAHDLRNPLSAIQLSADSLGSRLPAGDRNVTVIRRGARRMSRMVAQLLDFARARQGGGLRLTRASADLGAIVREVADEIVEAHPGRRIGVAASGDLRGMWDGDRLAQVASNLVANAVQHSPPDQEVRVEVDGRGADVVLSVHNGGAPIDPALLPTIFDPYRSGAAGAGSSGRLGLGLFIVDETVRAHGGVVDVVSTAAAGTTFRVRLPRAAPSHDPVDARPPSVRAAPSSDAARPSC